MHRHHLEHDPRHSPLGTFWRASIACMSLSFAACTVRQDDFRSEGGISPDPTAVVEGSVLYRGPAPTCAYRDGRPTRVLGRVVLTLFQFDNPPPPAGTATSVENVKFINGDKLFALTDCAPEHSAPEERTTISRAASFLWSSLELYEDARDYQIRGFFDADENMNPFFSISRMPSANDVIGAALSDFGAASPSLLRVRLPAKAAAKDGFHGKGVIVSLAAVVHTDQPKFKLSAERALASNAVLTIPVDKTKPSTEPATCLRTPTACIDRRILLENARANTCGKPITEDCGLALEALTESEAANALAAAGLEPSFAAERTAFYTAPVDFVTVRKDAPDLPVPDGIADPHPVLGASGGVGWFEPVVLMQRVPLGAEQALLEARAGIPEVLLAGSVMLDSTGDAPARSVYTGRMPVAVPPIAVVNLDPSRNDCRIPYVPPGNVRTAYEARVTHCGELPTGLYGVNVFAGVAGGEPRQDASSDLGSSYKGGRSSGQAWTVPNELGDAAQIETTPLGSQGGAGLFVVHDPDPATTGDCSVAADPIATLLDPNAGPVPVTLRGKCTEDPAPLNEVGLGVDQAGCLPAACCEAVAHLCGVPLCPPCDQDTCPALVAQGLSVRTGPRAVRPGVAAGKGRPDCVPFELPSQCCK
jgi:hypothetical protein